LKHRSRPKLVVDVERYLRQYLLENFQVDHDSPQNASEGVAVAVVVDTVDDYSLAQALGVHSSVRHRSPQGQHRFHSHQDQWLIRPLHCNYCSLVLGIVVVADEVVVGRAVAVEIQVVAVGDVVVAVVAESQVVGGYLTLPGAIYT